MTAGPLRVLIVDDSRIFRGVIEQVLSGCADVKIVGSVFSGDKALEVARTSLPDLVTLDIQMPGLGGIETLKALKELSASRKQPLGVLLVSAHTKRGAAITVEGLQEGAFDFITKPDGSDARQNEQSLRRQLLEKLAAFRTSRARFGVRATVPFPPARVRAAAPLRGTKFRALVVGASTGGPEVLANLLPGIAPECPVPIFLVQHLPADFTEYFAASLARRCGSQVVVAREGMTPAPRAVYVAPGGKHLVLHSQSQRVTIGLSDAPPENGCRPAVDVLFRSAALAYADKVLALVLTGMGSDGAKGALVLKRAGARILVQDEGSSVVWGMPGSTVALKAADEILSLPELVVSLRRHLGMGD